MGDNKRYYWIKLKTDFFNQETIDFLLSQENGCKYVVLYQMLCLQTANNNGELSSKIGEVIIPYDIEKITRDTKYFNFDTVVVALDLFKKLGLIYEEENKNLRIANYNEMIGSEVSSAQRVREFRERKKALQCNTNVTQEIEYRYKSIDIDKDKEINKEKEKKNIYQNEFEELWKLYPKKRGKDNALKSYVKARNDNVTYEKVLKGINNYNEYIKKVNLHIQFVKDGSTWFNQKRWEDEYIGEEQPKPKSVHDEIQEMVERVKKEEMNKNDI